MLRPLLGQGWGKAATKTQGGDATQEQVFISDKIIGLTHHGYLSGG